MEMIKMKIFRYYLTDQGFLISHSDDEYDYYGLFYSDLELRIRKTSAEILRNEMELLLQPFQEFNLLSFEMVVKTASYYQVRKAI